MRWLLLQIALLSLGTAHAQDDDELRLYFAYDGEDVTLVCNATDERYRPEDTYTMEWSRSENDRDDGITEGDKSKYQFTGYMNWEKMNLTVKDVQASDYGAYYCTVYNYTGEFAFRLRKAINVNGHQFASIGEKYKTPVTIGCVSAAVLLGLMLLIGFVYKFQYKDADSSYTVSGKQNLYATSSPKAHPNAFDNPALYASDDDQMKDGIEMHGSLSNGKEEITTAM